MDHFGAAKTPARASTIPCEERHESPGTDVSRGGGVRRRRRAQRVEGLQSGARPPRQPAPAEARKIVSPPESSQPSRRPAVRAPGQAAREHGDGGRQWVEQRAGRREGARKQDAGGSYAPAAATLPLGEPSRERNFATAHSSRDGEERASEGGGAG